MQWIKHQPFITVSAILEKDGEFILVKETKKIAEGLWNIPGGRLEHGENPIEGVKREVKEETRYDFEPTYLLGIYSIVNKILENKFQIIPHIIDLTFIGKLLDKDEEKLLDDVSAMKWFKFEEIEKMNSDSLRDPCMIEMIKDYINGVKYPLNIIKHYVIS
jgi:ADP-ribose pyrophosphatase YjhB (NUDIX family)